MDSTSIVESSGDESGDEVVDGSAKRPKVNTSLDLDINMIDIMSSRKWKQPNRDTIIPDLCYCEKCRTLFYSRRAIFRHFLSDHTGAASRKSRIDPLKRNFDLRKCSSLKEFLNWLLSLLLVDEDPKYFCNDRFKDICESTLQGIPSEPTFGDVMMWILTQTWGANDDTIRDFLCTHFNSPKASVDWEWFWEWNPLTRLNYQHTPPTICVYYDGLSPLSSILDTCVDEKEVDFFMDDRMRRLFLYQNKRYLQDEIFDDVSQTYRPQPYIECWDLEDGNAVEHFKHRAFDFYPGHDMSYSICGLSFYGYTVFELYSISIDKIDTKREFSLIYMSSHITKDLPMVIYKCPPEGLNPDDIGKPLSLKGPFRTPCPVENDVFISFTKSTRPEDHWYFGVVSLLHMDLVESINTVITHKCHAEAEEDKSTATIRYRVSRSAARAELTLTFVEEWGRDVYITRGSITATDGNDSRTRRIIRQYSEEESPVCLHSGRVLEVYRSQFGVPRTESYLRVEVELAYFVEGFSGEEMMIKGFLKFPRPRSYSSQGQTLRTSDASCNTFLCIETSWTTPLGP